MNIERYRNFLQVVEASSISEDTVILRIFLKQLDSHILKISGLC